MRTESLNWLVCPSPGCAGPLLPSSSLYPIYSDPAEQELTEAVLGCGHCGDEYPVILGVALLEIDLGGYLEAFWAEIESCAAELCGVEISRAMRSYLGIASDFTGQPGPAPPLPDLEWTTSPYLQAHFDPASLADDIAAGWWRNAVQNHLVEKNEPYAWLMAGARERTVGRADGLAVDVGTSVGRGAAELASLYGYSVGVDRSFRAILAARRHLLGAPSALQTYSLETEKGRWELRSLRPADPLGNLDYVVASGAALPVGPSAASCVAALNVLCASSDPLQMLEDFSRVLTPGGMLLLSSPFWSDSTAQGETPLAEGGPEYLRRALDPRFEIAVEQDQIPWLLRVARRRWDVYLCHCVVATRR
ncbi:hypothetical protein BH23ACT12_BH23ACT12_18840 [soil metagenome]